MLLNTKWPVSLNRWTILLAGESHSPFTEKLYFPFHFSSDPRPRNVQCPCENFIAYFLTFPAFEILVSLFCFCDQCHWTLTWRWFRPCSGSMPFVSKSRWISWRTTDAENPGKIFHSNSINCAEFDSPFAPLLSTIWKWLTRTISCLAAKLSKRKTRLSRSVQCDTSQLKVESLMNIRKVSSSHQRSRHREEFGTERQCETQWRFDPCRVYWTFGHVEDDPVVESVVGTSWRWMSLLTLTKIESMSLYTVRQAQQCVEVAWSTPEVCVAWVVVGRSPFVSSLFLFHRCSHSLFDQVHIWRLAQKHTHSDSLHCCFQSELDSWKLLHWSQWLPPTETRSANTSKHHLDTVCLIIHTCSWHAVAQPHEHGDIAEIGNNSQNCFSVDSW